MRLHLPRSRSRATAAILAAVLFAACSVGREIPYGSVQQLPIQGRLATTLDLLAGGRQFVDDYLQQLPEQQRLAALATIAKGEQATARVSVKHGFGSLGMSFSMASGTGVLVRGSGGSPLVLSAGHTFDVKASDSRVQVVALDGRVVEASMLDCKTGSGGVGTPDYAVLKCDRALDPDLVLPGTAAPRKGELIVALGYPDQCGVDRLGRVVRFGPDGADRIAPLACVLEVATEAPLQLVPVAGALPLGGFSGGGLFNLDGNVVGVLTNTEWSFGADSLTVAVKGWSVAAMPGL
jgi:S1-C subfamily serine protease